VSTESATRAIVKRMKAAGPVGWYDCAVVLSDTNDVPRDLHLLQHLEALERQGLVEKVGEKRVITPAGLDWLRASGRKPT
jgi:ribosomal protein S19E (S16A)